MPNYKILIPFEKKGLKFYSYYGICIFGYK